MAESGPDSVETLNNQLPSHHHRPRRAGGTDPISVAVHDNLVYVVNAGGNIAGFWLASSPSSEQDARAYFGMSS